MTESAYSLSDIATVTGGCRNDGGFGGGDWGAWIILFLLFGLFGGRGGFGGFGGGGCGCDGGCATQADVRNAVDQQTLISKLDQQTYGLADSTYALNNSITGGFAGVQQTLCQGFNGVNTSMLQGFNGINMNVMQGFNGVQSQIANCCCDVERAIDGVNYNIATQNCDIKNTIQNTTRDIIDNQNCNTRSILDFLVQDKIATLQSENQSLKLQASQAAQNAYLVNELRPSPIPAYQVANPYCCYGNNYGYNGCGCGCN